ncbi:MAG: nucleotidyl transferase AbiEii/AbiGii toxin family protein [Acidobacteria bacterium]|nr:nucleotidyl transferase AbiEii/AbiGii toxin family protein [Acidobacteriota bacterium]
MIDRREILELAREFGLSANVVEKDYVLGWLLAGIYNHPELSEKWIFKGGTCLKKCFFETYRFSEDLDFTLLENEHLNQTFLLKIFSEIAEWIYDVSGIELPVSGLRFELFTNPRGQNQGEGRVGYRGPLQNRGDLPRIKLDLTTDERLVRPPVVRNVHHPYSDAPENGVHARSYCYEEIFAEKLRALAERERPRDLYDVIHLYRRIDGNTERVLILEILRAKCEFKGIALPTIIALERQPQRVELQSDWEHMLGHQLPSLPPFEQFWRELSQVFEWLYESRKKPAVPSIPLPPKVDRTWLPPPMGQAWGTRAPLEVIRFAAANHLCVDLRYDGSNRLIEPYSLRRTLDGNLILKALRHDSGESRSYRVDRIDGAIVTRVPFVPRYEIELTPTGPIVAPMTVEPSYRPSRSPARSRAVSRPSGSRSASQGLTYVIRCTVCGKHFNRKNRNTKLNKHKNKSGYRCFGRTGYLVETKY